jgi:hypothetical protein
MTDKKQNNIKRGKEITKEYFAFLDQHIEEVANGNTNDFLELNQNCKNFARFAFASFRHLTTRNWTSYLPFLRPQNCGQSQITINKYRIINC